MIDGIGIRDKASDLGEGVTAFSRGAVKWIFAQLLATVDRPKWRAASGLRGRFHAVSWLRVTVIVTLIFSLVMVVLFAAGVFRHQPGPGPLPAEENMRNRAEAVKTFRPTPPAGLAEANQSTPRSAFERPPR